MRGKYDRERSLARILPPAGRGTVVARLQNGIVGAGLDCSCNAAANRMLDRIDEEEYLIRRAEGLADARKMRDAIVLVLGLLGELDELGPDAPDRGAFQEIAGLFEDVADFAVFGAGAAKRAAGQDL
jgi:hypothetical protein